MKLKYQRILYISFFLIFFIVGPILTLYATGFRYNIKKGQFEKTGVLVVESKPRGSNIFINSEFVETTPTHISRLLPQEYTLEVRRDGFFPWVKKVEVKSNETLYYQNIVLFRDTLPTVIENGEIGMLSMNPNGDGLFYSVVNNFNETIVYRTQKSNERSEIELFNRKQYDQLQFIEWSPQSQKALFKQKIGSFNQYYIFDTQTEKLSNLFDITRLNFTSLHWDQANNFILYGEHNDVLYQVNLINNITKAVLSDSISSFMVTDNQVDYITKNGGDSFLIRRLILNENPTAKDEQKIKLPNLSEVSLLKSPAGLITLHDAFNDDIFVIKDAAFNSETIEQEILLQAKAKTAKWTSDFKKLLYSTDFELSVFYMADHHSELITRYSSPLRTPKWHVDSNYIIFYHNDSIMVIEAFSDSNKNELTLTSVRDVPEIFIDTNGKNIYFYGVIGSQKGIYELTIQ